jgi:ubiquinone biosynthesis protein
MGIKTMCAAHLRLACEGLGTMFIKLGHMLSTRSDLLSAPYLNELVKLQSDVPARSTRNHTRDNRTAT